MKRVFLANIVFIKVLFSMILVFAFVLTASDCFNVYASSAPVELSDNCFANESEQSDSDIILCEKSVMINRVTPFHVLHQPCIGNTSSFLSLVWQPPRI